MRTLILKMLSRSVVIVLALVLFTFLVSPAEAGCWFPGRGIIRAVAARRCNQKAEAGYQLFPGRHERREERGQWTRRTLGDR